jgi:uncharacterized protein YebE (UPF0316 family)
MSVLTSALLIFGLRMVNITLDTLRLMLVVHRRRALSALVGFFQALIFVLALGTVLQNLNNPWNILGYAGGYSAGILAGMALEEWLAVGFSHVRIVSPDHGPQLAAALRAAGHGVTEFSGRGKEGRVRVVTCSARRRDLHRVERIATETDASCFITVEDIRPLRRGYWRGV